MLGRKLRSAVLLGAGPRPGSRDPTYTAEVAQDEQILAAIIAGGMASGRRVAPALAGYRPGQAGHTNLFGVSRHDDVRGPCCAVGAGVLYSGQRQVSYPPREFARIHGVHIDYTFGVTDGFEGCGRTADEPAAYARGVAVGSAAYDFFCGGDE